MLLKHGLLGEHKFIGKQGALDFVRQAGCIQFDPVDSCGRNAELTLQSRVRGFTKQMLYELLYVDRKLVDYPDKNLAIIPVEDWPYFERYRKVSRANGLRFEEIAKLEIQAMDYIRTHGPVSSDELPISGLINWHSAIHWSGNWSGNTKASRSVLEQLYSSGELVIHHKKGTRKYYDLAEKHISSELLNAADPLPDDFEHLKWRILRRIGAVGLLWNRPSDAWLHIWGMDSRNRDEAFKELLDEGKILEIKVEDVKYNLFCRAEDISIIEMVQRSCGLRPRCELIAPLDCMMWDRRLIKALFGFDYTWEIYTPADKRKYGYYVLPLLYGEGFIGRLEAAADKKAGILTLKNIWYEEGIKPNAVMKKVIKDCAARLARFNECDVIKEEKLI
jgi:uncharacterized protein YcaQ